MPAAGRGERLGPGAPKALRLLGGVPLLVHAVRNLAAARWSTSSSWRHRPTRSPRSEPCWPTITPGRRCMSSPGGSTRPESVRAALAALPDDVGVVLVHDAARPLAPVELIDAVASAVRAGADAVVPGLPVTDTVKRVDGDVVVETVDRSVLRVGADPAGLSAGRARGGPSRPLRRGHH